MTFIRVLVQLILAFFIIVFLWNFIDVDRIIQEQNLISEGIVFVLMAAIFFTAFSRRGGVLYFLGSILLIFLIIYGLRTPFELPEIPSIFLRLIKKVY